VSHFGAPHISHNVHKSLVYPSFSLKHSKKKHKELEEQQPGFIIPKDTTHTNMSICLLPPKCGCEVTYDG
jgi:hypothetical protein